MAVEFMDLLGEPKLDIGHSKKVLFSSDHFHTWIHGDYPGTKGPMHSHTADQVFYCVQGQCTFHFQDRDSQAINPGQMVLIPKGHHYQLHNTWDVYLVLMCSRAEAAGKPRFGTKGEEVGDNDYALKNPDEIRLPQMG